MAKLLLLSVIIATISIPVIASREANAVRGLKKAMVLTISFNILYWLAVRFVYPRLL